MKPITNTPIHLLAALLLFLVSGLMHTTSAQVTPEDEGIQKTEQSMLSVMTYENGEKIEATYENGALTELKIDGEVVDAQQHSEVVEKLKGRVTFDVHEFGTGDHITFGEEPSFGDFFKGQDFDKMLEQIDSMSLHFNNFSLEDMKFDLPSFQFSLDSVIGQLNFDNGSWKELENMLDSEAFKNKMKDMPEMGQYFNFGGPATPRTLDEIIEYELMQDDLIPPSGEYAIELDNKKLKVNGKKQSDELHQKYREIYGDHIGHEMEKKDRYKKHGTKNKTARQL